MYKHRIGNYIVEYKDKLINFDSILDKISLGILSEENWKVIDVCSDYNTELIRVFVYEGNIYSDKILYNKKFIDSILISKNYFKNRLNENQIKK